jgi:hypothetical protein
MSLLPFERRLSEQVISTLQASNSNSPERTLSALSITKSVSQLDGFKWVDKHKVNSVLYALEKVGSVKMIKDTPPRWYNTAVEQPKQVIVNNNAPVQQTEQKYSQQVDDAFQMPSIPSSGSFYKYPNIIIVVDLGTVQHALEKIEQMMKSVDRVDIMCFADKQTNCFGIQDNAKLKRSLKQSKTDDRFECDVDLIVDVYEKAEFMNQENESVLFLLLTKDLKFKHLKNRIEDLGHSMFIFDEFQGQFEAILKKI